MTKRPKPLRPLSESYMRGWFLAGEAKGDIRVATKLARASVAKSKRAK